MSTSPDSLVSVVTPFYNTGAFLEECIKSVLAQTHRRFEYVLFDNCSTDASSSIARDYAARDARIRYVKAATFVDQIPNYNRALREISPQSKYCKMVQADDWLFPECLEYMVRLADAHPRVGIVGAYALYGDKVGHGALPLSTSGVFAGQEAIRRYLMTDRGFLGSPTCVMFRSDLVRARDPFFSLNHPDYEDADACFQLLYRCDFGFVYQVLTFNRRDNEGIWTGIERLNPIALHNLLLLIEHGRAVLDLKQYLQRLAEVQGEYYVVLARASLRPYDKEFWHYHLHGLSSRGLSIDRMLLARKIALKIFDILGNPKMSLERLVRWIRAR